ncbi:alpha/beta fold hydrolase [Streptomyces albidus (ex Kaewkla and Franco 2022)]|uniref:alpha/beta fold hydrolase n=1 Tax=Streptomyces albidus (ex Kaewkla and Franco 2022) TaxID=722709 RepID=UPI0015EFB9F8|nr:alpha/beta hydrolase [Streptomyces albidus (ex Kaewkla and Franco 2022)]
MSVFVLVPGAGGAAWYWHRVVPELHARGHEAVAVDLPGADEYAGLPEYTEAVVAAIGDHDELVLVAQSMGGFTAPMVCARVPVDLLVLVNAMIPLPGETPGAWWGSTGSEAARVAAAEAGGYTSEFDLDTYFLHDVPAEVAAAGEAHQRPEADVAFGQPCGIERWPEVTTRVLAASEDRFFPVDFQRRVARERLGVTADVVPGGHLVALSHPVELVDRLIGHLP